MRGVVAPFTVAAVLLVSAGAARAGGFTAGTNGTQAVARGGAFVAKADDPTAIELNVAGLARQRGTRLLFDANVTMHTMAFDRAGVYPGDPNAAGAPAYAGMPYPRTENIGGAFFAPILGITTDFGYFDRWTFAIGGFGPPSVGNRKYGLTVNGLPSPGRYDIVNAGLLVIYPTIAAAVRVTKWLDLGLALHIAVSNVNFTTVSNNKPLGCVADEDPECDSVTNVSLTGATATFSFGALARPLPWLAFGVNLWGPTYLESSGTVTVQPPARLTIPFEPAAATLRTQLPWILRAGVRFIWMKDGRERADIEVDGQYEAWHQAQRLGPEITIPELGPFSDIRTRVVANFRDTFAVKVGGAYNLPIKNATLSFRLGFYFDSAATTYAYTRINFDTIAKYAGTGGIGLSIRGFTFNLSYAYVYSPERVVTNGEVRPISIFDDPDAPSTAPAINNGRYNANRQVVSLGFQIEWERLVGRPRRPVRYE
jgi:long-chain fatty acid transport protein